jgi:hypothetical protein
MQTLNAQALSADQTEWENQLTNYKKELVVLNNQLVALAARVNKKESTALIEHFHNQFVIQNENIDILKHDLHQHTKALVSNGNTTVTDELLLTSQQLKDQFESEGKVYKDLKQEFADFLAKEN